jgi:hypothetical protein
MYQEGANESYQQKNKKYKTGQRGCEEETQERQESQQSNQAGKSSFVEKHLGPFSKQA